MKTSDNLIDLFRAAAADIAEIADTQWRRLNQRLGLDQAQSIMAYRGYCNDTTVWVTGRLLANKPYAGPKRDDDWWDNLQATYARWESDEIPNAQITLRYGSQQVTVTTDEEGYYAASFERDFDTPGEVLCEYRGDNIAIGAKHSLQVAPNSARFLLLSDLDDTVIHTGITNMLVAARLTFLNNAKTRLPLAGAASLYRAIAGSGEYGSAGESRNPVFYVSNSPWNMYDLLQDFLELNDFPFGPILLRDLGIAAAKVEHKPTTLRQILERYDDMPAVLVGDSGEHDAMFYAQIARDFPDRILAIFIRDVNPGSQSDQDSLVDEVIRNNSDLDIPFLQVANSNEIAQQLARMGLLSSDCLAQIELDVARDAQRDLA